MAQLKTTNVHGDLHVSGDITQSGSKVYHEGNKPSKADVGLSNVTNVAQAAATTQVIAGTGLSGGGTLAANRTLSVSYGTASGTAAQGNDTRINNGQTAFGWGNHASAGYVKTDTTYTAGSGLTLSGTQFSLPITVSGTGTYVSSVTQTASGLTITLGTPPNSNTTYAEITVAEIDAGTASTLRTISGRRMKYALDKKADTTIQVIAGTGLTGGGTLAANRTLNVSYGTTAGTAAEGNDSRLSNSREWTAAVVTQAEAEAGTATTARKWTAQRVAQAISTLGLKIGTTASTAKAGNWTPTWSEVSSKPTSFTPSTHTHSWSQITDAPATATRWPTWTEVTSKPSLVETSRSISTGTGLAGGGNLTANRTLSIAAAYSPNTSTSLSSQNLDDLKTPGFYHQTANANATTARNYPIAQAGTLVVTNAAGVVQEYTCYNSGNKYYRGFYSTSWGAWKRVVVDTDSIAWARISGAPAHATRANTWAEVTGKPSLVETSRTISAGTGLSGGGTLAADRTLAVTYGTTAGTAAQGNDSRLSNSREWTGATVSQAEAEAGTATTRRAWTAQRVRQNVSTYAYSKVEVDTLVAGATSGSNVWQNATTSLIKNAYNKVAFPSPKTLTLPSNPAENDYVAILVIDGDMKGSTIARNGKTIMGLAENMTINMKTPYLRLDYVAGSWRIAS